MNGSASVPSAYRTRATGVRPRNALRLLTLLPALLLCLAALTRVAAAQTQPTELNVAAAADMQPVFEAIGPVFEQRTGIRLRVSYGSSAALSQQLIAHAPFDIFFSADFTFAEQVVASGLTESKNPTAYARGLLVLWAPKGTRFQPFNADVLSRPGIQSLAIANPSHAPYGRAAEAALRRLNLYDRLKPHLVTAESVGQAAQFALSGNAELALISQTLAISPRLRDKGEYALIPLSTYPEIRQTAVILKASPHRAEAHRLLSFVLSEEVQNNLPKLGLQPTK